VCNFVGYGVWDLLNISQPGCSGMTVYDAILTSTVLHLTLRLLYLYYIRCLEWPSTAHGMTGLSSSSDQGFQALGGVSAYKFIRLGQ
jgi:hypothetical protein